MSDIDRVNFEARFPAPPGVEWSDKINDYTYTDFRALGNVCKYSAQWKVWQAARADTHPPAKVPEGLPDNLRGWLFAGWAGCTNHGCIVHGERSGMHTNGRCACLTNAGRSQLNLLQSKLSTLVGKLNPPTQEGE